MVRYNSPKWGRITNLCRCTDSYKQEHEGALVEAEKSQQTSIDSQEVVAVIAVVEARVGPHKTFTCKSVSQSEKMG